MCGVFAVAGAECKKFSGLSDAELAELVKQGVSDAFAELTARYMSVIRAKAAVRRSTLLELDDLCQEGLLGLLNAAKTYNPSGGASFKTYAEVCIGNRLVMAFRAAASRKNAPFANSVPLSGSENINGPSSMENVLDPEDMLLDSENVNDIWQHVKTALSKKEFAVFKLYLAGLSYAEIAEKLSLTAKAADNAMQRVRMKLKKRISS